MNVAPHLLKPVYANIFDAIAIAEFDRRKRIFAKDKEGRYFYASESFVEDCGLELGKLLGATDYELAWAAQAEKRRAHDRRVMETRTDTFRPDTLLCANHVRMRVMIRKTALLDESLQVYGVAGIYYPVRTHAADKAPVGVQQMLHLDYEEMTSPSGVWTGPGKIPSKGSTIRVTRWGNCLVLGYFRDVDELGLLASPEGVPDGWTKPKPEVIHVFGVEVEAIL